MEDYYNNYLLDMSIFELSDDDYKLLDAACWLVDNNVSIRKTAKEFLIPKTSLHRYIHNERLKRISFELYGCVKRVLKNHTRRNFH